MPSRKGGHAVKRDGLMLLHGIPHAGRARGLYTVHLALRVQMLDGVSYAADEAAAAHRNQYDLHVGQLIQNFQADSTLPRNDLRVIEPGG